MQGKDTFGIFGTLMCVCTCMYVYTFLTILFQMTSVKLMERPYETTRMHR
jgi:hypothetical protein